MTLSAERLYTEGCNAARHYSNGVKSIRTISIGQGFAIIAIASYLFDRDQPWLVLILAIFGIMFTTVLFMLQTNYWKQFDAVLEYVTQLERKEGSEETFPPGPWSAYAGPRNQRFGRRWYRVLVMYGPYLLLLIALTGLAAYTLAEILGLLEALSTRLA